MAKPEFELQEPAIQRVLQVLLDDWFADRGFVENDWGSNRLLAATILAFPDQLETKERCECVPEDKDGCDECMSEADIPSLLTKARAMLGLEPSP